MMSSDDDDDGDDRARGHREPRFPGVTTRVPFAIRGKHTRRRSRAMSAAPAFDLQSPLDVFRRRRSRPPRYVAPRRGGGVELLALTDHDTVDGVPEALAAAREHGIRLSPAAELSAVHGEPRGPARARLRARPRGRGLRDASLDFRGDRARRIRRWPSACAELGLALDDGPLEERRAAGAAVGRPHLADAVLAHPANAERLARGGIEGRDALFPAYLVPGAPAYVPARARPSPRRSRSIHARRRGGGLGAPVLRPRRPRGGARHARAVRADGLDGVEVLLRHPHARADAAARRRRAARAPYHRVRRLPRARTRALPRVPRVRHLGLPARLGPIGASG